jgi:serine phosphatase RsbU (regulator of sigma subunit)
VAGFSLPKEGQIVNGDAWSYRIVDGTLAVLVCDGLGHGAEAARASTAAVECFLTMDWSGPGDALESIDRALRPTRGAAAAIGVIDDASGILTFCGVGNIVAGIVADGKTRHLVSQNGILGAGARRLTEFAYAWTRDATLVMHSDGISGRWQSERAPHLWSRHPALVAGALYRDLARGTDDVAVVGVRQHA